MGNILEITETRPTVQVTEAGNTLQVVAPNSIVITDVTPTVTITSPRPQIIVQNAGIQGPFGLNWRGEWVMLQLEHYLKADAVSYEGVVYYCIQDTSDLAGGQIINPKNDTTHWDVMVTSGATGINWRGEWADLTSYTTLDSVEYYGNAWICTATHTSSTSNRPPELYYDDSSYWGLIAGRHTNYVGNYAQGTEYYLGDVVFYKGSSWRSKVHGHTDNSPPETPSDYFNNAWWDSFAATAGMWLGTYDSLKSYYEKEIVEHNGSSWVCLLGVALHDPPSTSGGTNDSWQLVSAKGVQGIQGEEGIYWQGDWWATTTYEVDDAVYYPVDGQSYICTQQHTMQPPSESSSYWDVLVQKGDQGDESTVPGPAGGQIGNGYIYDGTTSGGSTTDGSCRFNILDLGNASTCWLANTDKDGNDLSEYVLSFNDSTSPMKCTMTLATLQDNQEFIVFNVGSITEDAGGWLILDLIESTAYAPDSTPFSHNDDIAISVMRTGDRGTEWQGTWDSATTYNLSDAVLHNGSTWICVQEGTDQEPTEGSSYWEILARGGSAGSAGSAGSGYLFDTATGDDPSGGELRLNNGTPLSVTKLYISSTDVDGTNLDTLYNEWIGAADAKVLGLVRLTSANDTTRWMSYEITDHTKDGNVHTLDIQNIVNSIAPNVFNDGEKVAVSLLRTGDAGLNWVGAYNASASYIIDDCVYYQGRAYICTFPHSSGSADTPSPDGAGYWEILTTGFEWRGTYDNAETYYKNDVVHYNGSTWICLDDDVLDITPVHGDDWNLFTSKGTDGADGADGTDMAIVGSIMMFGGETAPTNWHLCDGTLLDRTTYSALYAVIGTNFGSTDIDNFQLPDMADSFAMGVGGPGLQQIGDTGGENSVTLQKGDMPSHTHSVLLGWSEGSSGHQYGSYKWQRFFEFDGGDYDGQTSPPEPTNNMFRDGMSSGQQYRATYGEAYRNDTTGGEPESPPYLQEVGSGRSHENKPKFVTVNYIIKLNNN
jgi:microcystin-dependent protein